MVAHAAPIWGTIPGWLTLAGIVAGLVVFARGGMGSGEAVRSAREARDVLSETVESQRVKLDDANKEIATLQGKTDVTLALVTALSPISEWTTLHERRAQERHDASMVVLGLIAERLGPDPENGKGDSHS